MSKEFTISKADKMGDYDEKYGQTFYCETQEQLEPVMFNLMSGEVNIGDKITCEEVLLKTSKKGNDYHRLKKVKVIPSGQTYVETPSETPQSVSVSKPSSIPESKIEEILELLRENNEILKKLSYVPGEKEEEMPPDFLEYTDG